MVVPHLLVTAHVFLQAEQEFARHRTFWAEKKAAQEAEQAARRQREKAQAERSAKVRGEAKRLATEQAAKDGRALSEREVRAKEASARIRREQEAEIAAAKAEANAAKVRRANEILRLPNILARPNEWWSLVEADRDAEEKARLEAIAAAKKRAADEKAAKKRRWAEQEAEERRRRAAAKTAGRKA